MRISAKLKRLFTAAALYAGIIFVTLVLLDLALIALGILPPKRNLGNPTLGWIAAVPTGRMDSAQCVEYSTGDTITYIRNEEGIRTPISTDEIGAWGAELRIAVTGDSQTDLCATNALTHPGALETALTGRGVLALVLPYGAGGYSPLQDYLVFEEKLKKYEPDVLVLNLYTGNDFYDIMRSDDRPHFVLVDTGYMVAPPHWYRFDEPGTRRRSRILYLARVVGDRVGVRGIIQRIKALSAVAAEQGERLPTVLAYLNDLRRSRDPELGYPAALSAQMLNQ